MKRNLRKLQELIIKLEDNCDWQFPTKYLITEDFPINGKRQYELINLTAEIADEYILFNDAEKRLIEVVTRVLIMIHTDIIEDIKQSWINNAKKLVSVISLPDGTIVIETL